jgi:uncharacterized lipoprotein YddW (UPF0748 family)
MPLPASKTSAEVVQHYAVGGLQVDQHVGVAHPSALRVDHLQRPGLHARYIP